MFHSKKSVICLLLAITLANIVFLSHGASIAEQSQSVSVSVSSSRSSSSSDSENKSVVHPEISGRSLHFTDNVGKVEISPSYARQVINNFPTIDERSRSLKQKTIEIIERMITTSGPVVITTSPIPVAVTERLESTTLEPASPTTIESETSTENAIATEGLDSIMGRAIIITDSSINTETTESTITTENTVITTEKDEPTTTGKSESQTEFTPTEAASETEIATAKSVDITTETNVNKSESGLTIVNATGIHLDNRFALSLFTEMCPNGQVPINGNCKTLDPYSDD